MASLITDHLKEFVENTSVKGMGRMLKAKGTVFKLLWLFTVLFGAAIALYFFIELAILYASGDVLVVTKNDYVTDKRSMSPTLTFRNLNPLANYNISSGQIQQYMDVVDGVIDRDTWATAEQRHQSQWLRTVNAIFENIVMKMPSAVPKNFFVNCHLTYVCEESGLNHVQCVDNGDWEVIYSRLGKCFIIDTKRMGRCKWQSLSAMLYLDSFLKVHLPLFDMFDGIPYGTSAVIIVSEPNSLPNLYEDMSIDINAGEMKYVILDPARETFSDTDDCRADHTVPLATCVFSVAQKILKDKCDCVYGALASNEDIRNGTRFCGLLTPTLEGILKHWDCMEAQWRDAVDKGWEQCPQPCTQITYEKQETRAAWPHPSYQLDFWDTYIRHQPYSGLFKGYEDIYNLRARNPSAAFDEVRRQHEITENFLKLDIMFGSKLSTTIREHKLSLPLEGFIGTTGGIFNLWIGISFITVIEIMEVIMKLCSHIKCKRKTEKEVPKEEPTDV